MLTRKIKIKDLEIGGNNSIPVQSMLNVPLKDTANALAQIHALEQAGCQIIRAAVPDKENAAALKAIIKETQVPFVADIHFDYRLAIQAIESGVHKLRINPGNIGGRERVKEVVACLKEYRIPVRIGVNGGSLEKELLEQYHSSCPEALVESARRSIDYFNEFGYDNIVVSIKSSDVPTTIVANRLFSQQYDYPLHLGVTEAGAQLSGIVRSSVGLGALLMEGIGDTIRVSLTGDPVQEVTAGKEILKALNLLEEGVHIVSCPTCGRCKTDILSIVTQIKDLTLDVKKPVTVAVMGCAVNGPGEAKEADMGVACGNGNGVFFKKGNIEKTLKTKEIIPYLVEEIRKF